MSSDSSPPPPSPQVPQALTGMSLAQVEELVTSWNQPKFRAAQILDWVWKKHATGFDQMTNLPAALRDKLEENVAITPLVHERTAGSTDTSRKFLWRLADRRFVESVMLPASQALYGDASDRRTLCVSSQVGCAFACKFCASGLLGLTRNLKTSEIAGQIFTAQALTGQSINNLVFMGMGEPLANLPALLPALDIITAPWGASIGARHLTISTSGVAPKIRVLADDPRQIRLAISLHGASDDVRSQIMPVNDRWPISELFSALEYWTERKKQMITFEYILIDGINDSLDQARLLVRHARKLRAKVNLIPYNTVEGLPWVRPSETRCKKFLQVLRDGGVTATLRIEKGHDIDAACGQLRLRRELEEV